MSKSLYDISWQVSETEYRNDPALSYSTIAKFDRSGFDQLSHLFEQQESASLTFGSAVDSIITGGMQEFNDRFAVCNFTQVSPAIQSIVDFLFGKYHEMYQSLQDIPVDEILTVIKNFDYQRNWNDNSRINSIIQKGSEYYNALRSAFGKEAINQETFDEVLSTVRALKESPQTKWYFRANSITEDVDRLYQLKFKANIDGVDYRCMADLIVVDYEHKVIYPVDLKTSSKPEYEFYKSFIQWSYNQQARLYWLIIRKNLDADPFFKDFVLDDYRFIVANKRTLTPLVWKYSDTQKRGTLIYGMNHNIVLRDPLEVGKELNDYLENHPDVPQGINKEGDNDIIEWLNKLP